MRTARATNGIPSRTAGRCPRRRAQHAGIGNGPAPVGHGCADRVGALVVRRFLQRRGQQRHETRFAAAILLLMAQRQFFVPAHVAAIFRLCNPGDDRLDDGNLRHLGNVHIRLLIQIFRRAGLLVFHDLFGIDERELGSAGEELPEPPVIAAARPQ